jgi:general secretion pathway protein D
VSQDDLDSLGMEWMLSDDWEIAQKKGQRNVPFGSRERIMIGANSQNGGFTVGNRYLTDGIAIGDTVEPIYDNLLSVASVLTNPELKFVLHAMSQRGNTDLLSAPKVTTKSGAEATIKVVTEFIYPTEFTVSGISGSTEGAGQNAGTVGAVVEPGGFETREVGVILVVLPEVSSEGQMIDLSLTPEVVDFLRFEEYGSTYTDSQGNIQQLRMPQPIFHSRSVSTSISIYNGATVVMGGMISETRVDVDDKVPILGDVPVLGRLFRSRYEQSEKRNLLIFVTARLVDPAGRPIVGGDDGVASTLVPEAATEEAAP